MPILTWESLLNDMNQTDMIIKAGEFRDNPNKRITLLGMSGVGKTFLSNLLRKSDWFHYSGDYRIGSHYLDEEITDNIKIQAMQVPFLKDLLLSDSISINSNLSFHNLKPISSYIGKLGNPEEGGLALEEFKYRQAQFHHSEINAMLDVPAFIKKSKTIYGYDHFINDAGGSLCEIEDTNVFEILSEHTLILYLQANKEYEQILIDRAIQSPKPLFFREAFLDEHLNIYMKERDIDYIALIDPDDFSSWVFSQLFYSRIPRYEAIAQEYGYTISTDELFRIKSEEDFLDLIEMVIHRK